MEQTGTRHLEKYGEALCNAYLHLANYKWDDTFKCRREGCGHNKYYEGTTPYSRRCLKCKHDESVTAHTAFDKMRMPLTACIEIAKMVVEKKGVIKPSNAIIELFSKGHEEIQKRSVARMIDRILTVLKTPEIVFDEKLLMISKGNEFYGDLLLKGICNGKVYYSHSRVSEINSVVRLRTLKSTKISFAFTRTVKGKEQIFLNSVLGRELFDVDEEDTFIELSEFKSCAGNLDYYCYKKNGNGYEELMKILVGEYGTFLNNQKMA